MKKILVVKVFYRVSLRSLTAVVCLYSGMTSLCCSAFVQLGKNPEVIDGITRDLRDAELLNGELPPERLSQLPYLRKVVKELLRFAPPYGGGYRKVLKTFELEVSADVTELD